MTVHTPIRPDDVRRAYAKWAGHYDFTFALFGRKYIKQIVKKLNADLGDTKIPRHALDVGTGTGLSLPHFDEHIQVIGVDLSADMLARARKRVARKKLTNISSLFEMDATELKFIDGYFDAVLATFVMSVVPDPQKVLTEMTRVIRPGGRIYLFNHFKADAKDKRMLSYIERGIAPASRKIGFHADFCRSQLDLEACGLTLIEESQLGPLNMFTLLTLEKGQG
jgi:phosphatidylethanolamine/phosphatidyl-N-methylethanolamine N-methyltransferase